MQLAVVNQPAEEETCNLAHVRSVHAALVPALSHNIPNFRRYLGTQGRLRPGGISRTENGPLHLGTLWHLVVGSLHDECPVRNHAKGPAVVLGVPHGLLSQVADAPFRRRPAKLTLVGDLVRGTVDTEAKVGDAWVQVGVHEDVRRPQVTVLDARNVHVRNAAGDAVQHANTINEGETVAASLKDILHGAVGAQLEDNATEAGRKGDALLLVLVHDKADEGDNVRMGRNGGK
mmetsp:Transcript_7698/g.24690  ORF Transcript_7698/g.24690 Transcript_7698/m.24690 type:complete len:232 (+) Transcript_7698:1684-2379(+)